MSQNNQIGQQPNFTQITAAEFGAKYQSKREVYRFLATDCRAYLPSYDTVTIFHLKELAAGIKTWIECEHVKVISIPQFQGLNIEQILQYAGEFQKVVDALPPQKETLKFSRAYLGNLIYTLIGEPFQKWIKERIDQRNKKVALDNNMLINMDPRIAEIFRNSTAVSVSNGNSHNLMKFTSKRRRSKLQILADKSEQLKKMKDIETQIAEYKKLETQLLQSKNKVEKYEGDHNVVQEMLASGFIKLDENGKYVPFDMSGQSQRSSMSGK